MSQTQVQNPQAFNKQNSIKEKYDHIARWYDVFELIMELLFFSRWRRQLFNQIKAKEFLEIGVGTGKNLRYYPADAKVTAIDFSENMLKYAKQRADKMRGKVNLMNIDIQEVPFKSNSFPNVLATFVFCSVPDPAKGLNEAKRVCAPNGHLVLLEHVRPKNPLLARIFDWLNPLVMNHTGVNINRNTVNNIQKAGFKIEREKNLLLDIFKLIIAKPK